MIPLSDVVELAPRLATANRSAKRITPTDFLKAVGEEDPGRVLASLLGAAASEKSTEILDSALYVKGTFGTDAQSLNALMELSGQSWHDHHEEIAMGLAQCGDDRAVPILARWITTLPEPLEDGDGNSLPLKAAHGLITIGTERALAALYDVRESDEDARQIIDYALDSRKINCNARLDN